MRRNRRHKDYKRWRLEKDQERAKARRLEALGIKALDPELILFPRRAQIEQAIEERTAHLDRLHAAMQDFRERTGQADNYELSMAIRHIESDLARLLVKLAADEWPTAPAGARY